LRPGDFDWRSIFDAGVRWFHTGGIFAALSETTPELIIEAMEQATSAEAVVSFDLNYRPNCGRYLEVGASAVDLTRIVEHVDVLVGNEEDLQSVWGSPDLRARDRASSEHVPRDDRPGRESLSADQGRRDDARATVNRPIGTRGARWPGSPEPTMWRRSARLRSSMGRWRRRLRVGLFYGLLNGESPAASSSAGPMAHSSRRSRATRWRP
jgi:2-dehydro-3-deoxygluconokinase